MSRSIAPLPNKRQDIFSDLAADDTFDVFNNSQGLESPTTVGALRDFVLSAVPAPPTFSFPTNNHLENGFGISLFGKNPNNGVNYAVPVEAMFGGTGSERFDIGNNAAGIRLKPRDAASGHAVEVFGGDGAGFNYGGNAIVQSGRGYYGGTTYIVGGTATGYTGGSVNISGGQPEGGGYGGNVFIKGGVPGGGFPGSVFVEGTEISLTSSKIYLANGPSTQLSVFGAPPQPQQTLSATPTTTEISTLLRNYGLAKLP